MKKVFLILILFLPAFGFVYGQNKSSSCEDSVRIVLLDRSSMYGAILEQNESFVGLKEASTGSIIVIKTWEIYDISTWNLGNYQDDANQKDFDRGVFDRYQNVNSSY